jgi:hypothetical protein
MGDWTKNNSFCLISSNRHHTKGVGTNRPNHRPPRHISTLPKYQLDNWILITVFAGIVAVNESCLNGRNRLEAAVQPPGLKGPFPVLSGHTISYAVCLFRDQYRSSDQITQVLSRECPGSGANWSFNVFTWMSQKPQNRTFATPGHHFRERPEVAIPKISAKVRVNDARANICAGVAYR